MAVSLFCPNCHKHTALSIAPVEYNDEFGELCRTEAIWEAGSGRRWWIGICNGCHEPSLVLNKGEIVFPQPLPSPTDPRIPKEIALDLDEAKMCFSVKCYRACAVMARRSMESACVAKNATADRLVDKIAALAKDGVITKEIADWATVVRWVGNDAAHPELKEVTKQDAEACLQLTEQFLHVIFVTTAIANATREARGKP